VGIAFEQRPHPGIRLELLAGEMGIAVGILRVERRHVAVRDQIVLHVVEPHPVETAQDLRKLQSVDDASRLVLLRIDAPDLLDARLIGLRVDSLEVEALDQLLGERAAHAFPEHGDLGEDVHAGLEGSLRLALLVHAHVAGAHADDAAALDEDLVARKTRIDLHAGRLGALRQPLCHLAERHDVVALLLEIGRHDGCGDPALRVEEPEGRVVAHVLGGKTLLVEVGDQLADRLRIHHAAREHVVAHVGALLEHQHRGGLERISAALLGFAVVRLDAVHQVDCGCQRGRAGSHVEDVDLHALSLDLGHELLTL
jgi:hypothetical protein